MTAPMWLQGDPINVRCTRDGRPLSFMWNAHAHQVARVCNRWRVSAEWWREDAAAWREYLKLATRDGLLCLVARDLGVDRWWLIRLYE
jgi:DNA-directed RNA polymerase subunit N (RpoN/RPB10)